MENCPSTRNFLRYLPILARSVGCLGGSKPRTCCVENKGREGKGRELKGGKGKERKGRERKGREGKGRKGKGIEGKGREGKGRGGEGREGKGTKCKLNHALEKWNSGRQILFQHLETF